MSIVSGIGSSILGSAFGSSGNNGTNASTGDNKKYDIQSASQTAGEQLIKEICKTLNSPENKIFSHVVENSFKSYFSEANASMLKPTIQRVFDNAIEKISSGVLGDDTLQKNVLFHFVEKHRDVLRKWIGECIKLVGGHGSGVREVAGVDSSGGNVNAHLPDILLLKYASAIVDEIINTEKTVDWETDSNDSNLDFELESGVNTILGGGAGAGRVVAGGREGRRKRRTYKRRGAGVVHKRKTVKHWFWGGGVGDGEDKGEGEGEGEDGSGDAGTRTIEDIEKDVLALEDDFKNGRKTQTETVEHGKSMISNIKTLIGEKRNRNITAKQNNSSSVGVGVGVGTSGSGGGCDNIMDNILKGKELSEQEKTILKYMDFRFSADTSQYSVNSKIMYVLENAMTKQMTSDTMKSIFEKHFDTVLPRLIQTTVDDFIGNTTNMVVAGSFSSLMKNKGCRNIVENAIMKAYRMLVEKNSSMFSDGAGSGDGGKSIMFNNIDDILTNIRESIKPYNGQPSQPSFSSSVENTSTKEEEKEEKDISTLGTGSGTSTDIVTDTSIEPNKNIVGGRRHTKRKTKKHFTYMV